MEASKGPISRLGWGVTGAGLQGGEDPQTVEFDLVLVAHGCLAHHARRLSSCLSVGGGKKR